MILEENRKVEVYVNMTNNGVCFYKDGLEDNVHDSDSNIIKNKKINLWSIFIVNNNTFFNIQAQIHSINK